jgi:hypothetical protein
MSNNPFDDHSNIDARDWARQFASQFKEVPDEETLIAWFANAITRGLYRGYADAKKLYDNMQRLTEFHEALPQRPLGNDLYVTSHLEMVSESLRSIAALTYRVACKSPDDARAHRAQLMTEELGELLGAMATNDRLAVLSEGIDLQYTTMGTMERYGFYGVYYEGERRVHAANMAKVSAGVDVAGRAQKPKDWTPAQLGDLVAEEKGKRE